MNKCNYIFLAMASLCAACAQHEEWADVPTHAPDTDAIAFGTYVTRPQTRVGYEGLIGNNADLQAQGFGIFAFYSDGDGDDKLYDAWNLENAADAEVSTAVRTLYPNFMYNQKVEYADTDGDGVADAWHYAPLKYWPNEHGSEAKSAGVDRLSFFAYAPYIPVDVATLTPVAGFYTVGTEGIVRISSNERLGDPVIHYRVASKPQNSVDLLWGVADRTIASADAASYFLQNGPSITAGLPWKDLTKMAVGQKVTFQFKHALASMAFDVDAVVNNSVYEDESKKTTLDANTKVFLREVAVTANSVSEGVLNLNNTRAGAGKPQWRNVNTGKPFATGTTTTLTFKDGRNDGSPATADATEVAALNSKLVQGDDYDASEGVTTTARDLFDADKSGGATTPWLVIPVVDGTQNIAITVTYDVETKDANLGTTLSDGTTPGKRVRNVITKSTTYSLAPGKAYTFHLHLGLNDVTLDAEAEAWEVDASATDVPVSAN